MRPHHKQKRETAGLHRPEPQPWYPTIILPHNPPPLPTFTEKFFWQSASSGFQTLYEFAFTQLQSVLTGKKRCLHIFTKLPFRIIKHNENQLENLWCNLCWERCTTDHCPQLLANFQANNPSRGGTFSTLCVSAGDAHACIKLLDVVTQWVPQHLIARESCHRVSWKSRAQFTSQRVRSEACVDEEWKKCPSLWTRGTGQLWGTSTNLGQKKHFHCGFLSFPWKDLLPLTWTCLHFWSCYPNSFFFFFW